MDLFGLSLETFAALWAGEDLAPVHGRIKTPPRGRNDSNVESQGTASGAVAAFVSADSAGVSTGWGSAGVSVVAVVVVVGRHVSFGWMSARSTGDLWLCDLFGVVEVGRMFGLLRSITPESRLLLVHFASSIAARHPVIKVAGKQSDSTELSETVSKQFRLRSRRSYSRAQST